jgi:hypothetical protein
MVPIKLEEFSSSFPRSITLGYYYNDLKFIHLSAAVLHSDSLLLYPILVILIAAKCPGSCYLLQSEWLNWAPAKMRAHENDHSRRAKYYHVYIEYLLVLPLTALLESRI